MPRSYRKLPKTHVSRNASMLARSSEECPSFQSQRPGESGTRVRQGWTRFCEERQQRQFSRWDSSVGQYNVTWSVQEGASGGSVIADLLHSRAVFVAPSKLQYCGMRWRSAVVNNVLGQSPPIPIVTGLAIDLEMPARRKAQEEGITGT